MQTMLSVRRWIAIFGLGLATVVPCAAQERPAPRLPANLADLAAANSWEALFLTASAQMIAMEMKRQEFWNDPRAALAAATAELVVQPNPLTRALMRMRGKDWAVWHERRDDLDSAPDLNPDWLRAVRDGTTMPDFRGKAPDLRRKSDLAVYDAYCQAVLFARIAPMQAFEKSADDFKHVTFSHLWNEFDRMKHEYKEKHFDEPNKYRGKVLRVQGELLRLRKYPAPTKLLDQGADQQCVSVLRDLSRSRGGSEERNGRPGSRRGDASAGDVLRLLLQDVPLSGAGRRRGQCANRRPR
jgi:hypothetical protein